MNFSRGSIERAFKRCCSRVLVTPLRALLCTGLSGDEYCKQVVEKILAPGHFVRRRLPSSGSLYVLILTVKRYKDSRGRIPIATQALILTCGAFPDLSGVVQETSSPTWFLRITLCKSGARRAGGTQNFGAGGNVGLGGFGCICLAALRPQNMLPSSLVPNRPACTMKTSTEREPRPAAGDTYLSRTLDHVSFVCCRRI